MARRILLVGYYGKGNFGDDVLLMTTYQLLRARYADAAFSVIIDGDRGEYVKRLLPEVNILPPGRHGEWDMIVHGGGGVLFDFARYGLLDRLIEQAATVIGFKSYVAMENIIRRALGLRRTHSPCRIGIGIGVGRFSRGSVRLRERLGMMQEMKALWVRDGDSMRNLKRFRSVMHASVIEGSDMAFLQEQWLAPFLRPPREPGAKPVLGIALRDWPVRRGGIAAENLRVLIGQWSTHYDIRGLILDAVQDPEMIRALEGLPITLWQPHSMQLTDFAHAIAACDVVLTNRAHGAIVAAMVGVPSVIVAIEPKLDTVAMMLPRSSIRVAAAEPESWRAAIEAARRIDATDIAVDAAHNAARSRNAWKKMQEVLP